MIWATGHPFAEAYIKRNWEVPDRWSFWRNIQNQYAPLGGPILEVGCGVGHNLGYLIGPRYGVDVNENALAVARGRVPIAQLVVAEATALPYSDGTFGLVFTCGLLIHLDPMACRRAMTEIIRVSSKYVLAIEYASDVEGEVPYRGQRGALWKRPYGALYEVMGLDDVGHGFLGKDRGFDDCTWWMLRK